MGEFAPDEQFGSVWPWGCVMEVILLERVDKLGQMGQIVKVKPGYARNYLLPKKKALRATKDNRAYFETQRAQLEAANLERRNEAEYVSQKMTGATVTVLRQAGETGVLYGSVSARDVADGLGESGFSVHRNQVAIDPPIKTLGLFHVKVVLHPEVEVSVVVNVARSKDEADLQRQRGGMVTAEEAAAAADSEAFAEDESVPADEEQPL